MKILKFLFILFFIFNINNAALAKSNDQLELKISKNLRCLICQGQSIYDSQSDFAVSMKLLINKKINEGLNEKEIYFEAANTVRMGRDLLYLVSTSGNNKGAKWL